METDYDERMAQQDAEMEQAMNTGLLFHYAPLSNLAEIVRTRTIKSGAARALEVNRGVQLRPEAFGSSPHGHEEIIFEACFSLDGVELPVRGDGEEPIGFLAIPFTDIARKKIPDPLTPGAYVFMFFPNSYGGGPNFEKEVHVANVRKEQYGATIELTEPTTIALGEDDRVKFYVPKSQRNAFAKNVLKGTRGQVRSDLENYIDNHLDTYRDIGESDTSRVEYAAVIGHSLTQAYCHDTSVSASKYSSDIKPERTKVTGNISFPFHSRILEQSRTRPVYYVKSA